MDARSCLRHPKQYPLSDYPSTLHDKRPLHTRFELVLAFREGSAIKMLCLILPRKRVKGFVKEKPENGRNAKQVCAAI